MDRRFVAIAALVALSAAHASCAATSNVEFEVPTVVEGCASVVLPPDAELTAEKSLFASALLGDAPAQVFKFSEPYVRVEVAVGSASWWVPEQGAPTLGMRVPELVNAAGAAIGGSPEWRRIEVTREGGQERLALEFCATGMCPRSVYFVTLSNSQNGRPLLLAVRIEGDVEDRWWSLARRTSESLAAAPDRGRLR